MQHSINMQSIKIATPPPTWRMSDPDYSHLDLPKKPVKRPVLQI